MTPRLFLMALLSLACSRPPHDLPGRPSAGRWSKASLPHLGYTLQAGAFSNVNHAARFSESLQTQGLEAIYYRSSDGFYRVRFGSFTTRLKARAKGEALRSAKVIESFWVVAPEEAAPGLGPSIPSRSEEGQNLRASLVETAKGYLGVPYLFGGTNERGFDCSGLTGAVYRLNGLGLPRSTTAQFEAGSPIALDKALPGDLVFFGTSGSSRVNHVGLLVGSGVFIHAPRPGQGIRQDHLSDRYYERAFLGARTYL